MDGGRIRRFGGEGAHRDEQGGQAFAQQAGPTRAGSGRQQEPEHRGVDVQILDRSEGLHPVVPTISGKELRVADEDPFEDGLGVRHLRHEGGLEAGE